MLKNRFVFSIFTISSSSILYFYSFGFHDIWALAWIAPIPILVYGLQSSLLSTFIISLISFLLGSCDIFRYTTTLLPIMPLMIDVFLGAICFAIIISISCWAILRLRHWTSVFIFPSLWTSYEFLSTITSVNGSYPSIAYSQVHFLQIIQLASLTGIWGISFLLCLIPSSITVAYFLRKNKIQSILSLSIPFILLTSVYIYGIIQLNKPYDKKILNIAVIALPTTPDEMHSTDKNIINKTLASYLKQLDLLKDKNIDLALLPEKIARILPENQSYVFSSLSQTAKKNKMAIIAGFAQLTKNQKYNIATAYANNGKQIGIYQKQHLLPGPESIFTPGNSLVTFQLKDISSGIAICKDMDFKEPAQIYGRNGTGLLFVPALDFSIDEWSHARIAILQGVANGFAVVRAGQWGLLSVSDDHGRVISKTSTSPDLPTVIITKINPGKGKTFYSQSGDWFAWLTILFVILLIFDKRRH